MLTSALSLPASGQSLKVDLASDEGFRKTCPQYVGAKPGALSTDAQRVAYAVCNGMAIAQDVFSQRDVFVGQGEDSIKRLRSHLEAYVARITQVRSVLEAIRGTGPYLTLAPGEWRIDLDRNGSIDFREQYLFWVPKRGLDMNPMQPAQSPADIQARYVSPVIRVDRSDILWAIAYCDFAEAALHLVLSYDLPKGFEGELVLVDEARVRKSAYPRLMAGIQASRKLRDTVMEETDDDHEWIANPKQTDTAFPLVMDAQTFESWTGLLKDLDRIVSGKALLGGMVDPQGRRTMVSDLTFGLCPPGQGLDVKSLFDKPLRKALDREELKQRCAAPTAARPMTGLAALATESLRRNANRLPGQESGEWTVLRYLYWVN